MKELKVGTSSVRGVIGDGLTPELAMAFAAALGTWTDAGPVVIARDPRNSSLMLRAAAVSALLSVGCEVIDLGVCPTPLLSFAIRELGAAGGLSLTGSHNSERFNALKFLGDDGAILNGAKGDELLELFHAGAPARALPDAKAKLSEMNDRSSSGVALTASQLYERYLEHLFAQAHTSLLTSRKFRVAVDYGSGAAGPVITPFLERLGCIVFPVYEEPSQAFAAAPSRLPAGARALAAAVRSLDVDLGARFNGDGDRVALVLADGTPLSEEYTLPLAALGRLTRRPGTVVTNWSTSRSVDAVALRFGERVVRTSVGEGPVVDRGVVQDAVLAGEGSGGVAVLPASVTFDAALTLTCVLEGLAASDQTLTQAVGLLPRLFMHKGELSSPPNRVYGALQEFRRIYRQVAPNFEDGVHVSFPDAWLHVRASNTEPLLRVIVEADNEDRARLLFAEAMDLAARAIRMSGEAAS